MTSKIVVNNIEADAGVSTVTFNSNIVRGDSNLHSTGLALGAGSTVGAVTGVTTYYGDGSQLSGISVDSTKIETGNTKVETIDTGSDGHIKVTTEGGERLRITSGGSVGINTSSPESNSGNASLHLHGTANDECRIAFSTPTKSNPGSRIGYYGLSNRFGMDVYNGFEIRDVAASYATRFKIDSNGYMTNSQPYAYFRFNAHSDSGSLQKQTNVNTVTVQSGMAHDGSGRFTVPVTGKYLIGSDNNVLDNSDHYCAVYINGSNQDGMRYQNTATNQSGNVNIWKSSSRTCILTLSANDYIEIYVKGAQDNASWNQHFIYLIG